jgi:hypothetical protein
LATKTPTVPTSRSQLAGISGDVSTAITINRSQFPWALPNTPPTTHSLPTVPGLSFNGAILQTHAPQFFQSGVTSVQMAQAQAMVRERQAKWLNDMLSTYLTRVRQSVTTGGFVTDYKPPLGGNNTGPGAIIGGPHENPPNFIGPTTK